MDIKMGLESLNFPTEIDWFNSAVLAIIIAIITGTVNSLAKKDIKAERALAVLVITLTIAFGLILAWYNLIGLYLFQMAIDEQESHGCGIAASIYERAVIMNPKIANARYGYIGCKEELQELEQTLEVLKPLEKLLTNDPVYWEQLSTVYYGLDDFPSLSSALKRYAELSPKQASIYISNRANELMIVRKYKEAEQILRIARMKYDDDYFVISWLAWALSEQNKLDDALYHFELCLDKTLKVNDTVYGRCFAGKGFVLEKLGDFDEARIAFEFALYFNPNQPDVENALQRLP